MRLDAASVVNEMARSFGLEDVLDDIINKISRFKIGRLLLMGNWVNEPTICLTAPNNCEWGQECEGKTLGSTLFKYHQVNQQEQFNKQRSGFYKLLMPFESKYMTLDSHIIHLPSLRS